MFNRKTTLTQTCRIRTNPGDQFRLLRRFAETLRPYVGELPRGLGIRPLARIAHNLPDALASAGGRLRGSRDEPKRWL